MPQAPSASSPRLTSEVDIRRTVRTGLSGLREKPDALDRWAKRLHDTVSGRRATSSSFAP
jgi:hypothetical protein